MIMTVTSRMVIDPARTTIIYRSTYDYLTFKSVDVFAYSKAAFTFLATTKLSNVIPPLIVHISMANPVKEANLEIGFSSTK